VLAHPRNASPALAALQGAAAPAAVTWGALGAPGGTPNSAKGSSGGAGTSQPLLVLLREALTESPAPPRAGTMSQAAVTSQHHAVLMQVGVQGRLCFGAEAWGLTLVTEAACSTSGWIHIYQSP
jgi:hypothetical protein